MRQWVANVLVVVLVFMFGLGAYFVSRDFEPVAGRGDPDIANWLIVLDSGARMYASAVDLNKESGVVLVVVAGEQSSFWIGPGHWRTLKRIP